MRRAYFALFTFLIFAIPFERRYDKPWRFFSKSLIPADITLPKGFDYKLYFYPSDLLVPILLLLAFFIFKFSLRQLFIEKGMIFLWLLLSCMTASILASPLAHYSLLYTRLWQWITPAIMFFLASNTITSIRPILAALTATGICQSIIAIAQYFHQGSIGLSLLGEPNFNHLKSSTSCIIVPNGARWIFDNLFHQTSEAKRVVRVMGTTDHPNVLGTLLAITSFTTLFFFKESKRKLLWASLLFLQLLALTVTYCRSAIVAFAIGSLLYLYYYKEKAIALSLAVSAVILSIPFYNQYLNRIFTSERERIELQEIAFKEILNNPFFGTGLGQFSLQTGATLPHNIYLLFASETGTVSLICFITFLITIFRRMEKNPTLLTIFFSLLVIGFVDLHPTVNPLSRFLLFLTAGLLLREKTLPEKAAVVPQ